MPQPDPHSPHTERFVFGRFVLDPAGSRLMADGREVPLRPEAFAILRHLVEHPGETVAADALLDAAWPGMLVGEESLAQAVADLRRALGDADARVIVGDAGGGYRLDIAAAPPERRGAAGGWRWQWRFGLLAPLVTAVVFVAIWLLTSRGTENPLEARPAIAVLPLLHQDGEQGIDPARDWFADGLTEDVIRSLGRFSGLTVMSWNAVATYKGAVAQPGEIARVLAVRYQVEGSVRRDGSRVELIVQLVDVQGTVLWTGRYDEPLAGLPALPGRIAGEIAEAVEVANDRPERRVAAAVTTRDPRAYELALRAQALLREREPSRLDEASALLRQAVEVDPTYADAHAALGETWLAVISTVRTASAEDWQRVVEHAGDALGHDPTNARARVLLGRWHLAHNRFAESELQFRRAIDANPNDADALGGRGNVLLWLGRTAQAIEALERAQRIDPGLGAADRFALALAYYTDGQYERAIEQGEINLLKSPQHAFDLAVLAAAYAQTHRTEDVSRTVAQLHRRDPAFDATRFGNRFQDTQDRERLRRGLANAGLANAGLATSRAP